MFQFCEENESHSYLSVKFIRCEFSKYWEWSFGRISNAFVLKIYYFDLVQIATEYSGSILQDIHISKNIKN